MRNRTFFLLAALLLIATAACNRPEEPEATPKLADELNQIAAGFAEKAPASLKEAFAKGIADVEASGVVEGALGVGEAVPDATLLTTDGEEVSLSAIRGAGPLVVVFYRGGWCPYCNAQLRAIQRAVAEIEGAGAGLVAISPELPAKAQQTAAAGKLSLRVLTDRGNTLAHKLGIAFTLPEPIAAIYKDRFDLESYNGDTSNELPLAATYVIDGGGVIRYAFVDADYKKRAEPADVVAAVKKLAK